jgi:hypothetical protein
MPSTERWLLRDVAVSGKRLDCRIRDGRIAELAPRLTAADGEMVIEGNGGELLPGPWATLRAAVTRACDGVPVGPDDERVTPTIALASMLTEPHDPAGAPRLVRVGAPADLCLLDGDLPTALHHAIRSDPSPVQATFIAGRLCFRGSRQAAQSSGEPRKAGESFIRGSV